MKMAKYNDWRFKIRLVFKVINTIIAIFETYNRNRNHSELDNYFFMVEPLNEKIM